MCMGIGIPRALSVAAQNVISTVSVMKQPTLRFAAVLTLLVGACVARLPAATITLDVSDLLGWVDPSNPNDAVTHTAQVKFFVDAYNLGTAEGTNLGDNPNDGNPPEVNWLYRPDSAPISLATPLLGTKVETSNPVVDLGGFTYEYILFKQNTSAWIYYIGDIAGTNSINWGGNPLTSPDKSNENGSEISHYMLFNKNVTPTQHRVPEGGTTVLLVGAGLLLTALTVRAKKSA